MRLDPNALPSANLDLSNWKLQLPIDAKGTFSGKAAEVTALGGYVHREYFLTGSDGAVVLAAPVEGATTGGSIYARSELREMNGSAPAAWSVSQGGRLTATLQVDGAPNQADGTYGKVVVGQIHGGDKQMVRLAWEDGKLFFANDITTNGTKDVHIELLDAKGNQPSISLNETFSYSLDVSGGRLTVSALADGQVYTSSTQINSAWNDKAFYFKAGTYLGINEQGGDGSGQVSLFALNVDHGKGGSGSPALPPVIPSPAPVVPPTVPEHTSRTFAGTNGDDNLRGKTTNDYMVGDSGNDRINGAYGHDVLFGGSGDDVFVFDRKASSKGNSDVIKDFTSGEDTLELSSAKMLSLQQGFTSENLFFGAKAHDSNDFIVYNQDSGQLFYDRDGSGSGTAQLIATLENHTALKVYDFDII